MTFPRRARLAPAIRELAKDVVEVTVEMGRFFAASCGTYLTRVVDLKENEGTNYCILDGGINHLTYAGQVMGLKVPVTCQPLCAGRRHARAR